MSTTLHDAAFADKVDCVTLLDRAQPVCDGDGRSALGSSVESILDYTFTVTVESGSGLIEQENGRISEQGTRNSNSLCKRMLESDPSSKEHEYVRF